MTTAATISARLVLDSSDYDDGLSKAGKKADDFGQKWKDVGSKLSTVGRNMTAFVTVPIIGMGAAAVNAASDLNETKNKIDVIFGDMSKEITKWSETSATALGQSQTQALDAASNFAIFGKAANLAGDDLVKFSEQNVTLASDLASFFNTNPEEAITAIGAAYRGESEPIRKYGVLINEAAVKTKALEMGLISEGEALSQQNRILAVNALIMDQTTAAQGDFARTSDGLANSTRIMQAQLKDAAAALGQQLLPFALKAVQVLSGFLSMLQKLPAPVQKIIVGVLLFVAALGPLLMIAGSIASAIGSIITILPALSGAFAAIGAVITGTLLPAIGSVIAALVPVILPILAIIAVLALLYLAWKNNWFGIRDIAAQIWAGLKALFKQTVDNLIQVWNMLKPAVEYVLKFIMTVVAAFQAAFNGDWYRFGQLLRQAWDMLWKAQIAIIQAAWNGIKQAALNIVNGILSVFKIDWSQIGKSIVQGIVNGLNSLVGWALQKMRNFAKGMADAFNGFFGIHSPSTWAEDRAAYIRKGFEREWNTNPIMMSPSPVLASMPTPATASPMGGVGGIGGTAEIVTLLRQLVSQGPLDVNQLTRMLRDAILISKD